MEHSYTIDLRYIAQLAGYLVTICSAGAAVYAVIKKYLTKYILTKIKATEEEVAEVKRGVKELKSWTEKQQEDINLAAERDSILMEAQLASLEAIHQDKNNGNVDSAIAGLKAYMAKRSSKPSSYAEK